jgi:DNA-binding NarL/FixJ family response regulator
MGAGDGTGRDPAGKGRLMGTAILLAALLQPHITDALRAQARRAATRSLTARQQELLQLVAAGHHNWAIARQLELSPDTVRKHLENTFARLGVASRTEAIAKIRPDSA